MTGKIRIIAGSFRGKIIPVIHQVTLRPTPNRVRETLFNWLMHDIRQLHCLDAFAGTGALGFEAYSRGAKTVMLLEKDHCVFKQLKQTAHTFQSPAVTTCHIDFFEFLKRPSAVFDLIFLDPPFEQQWLADCLEKLYTSPALKPHGLVYLESNIPLPLATPQWDIVKSAKAASIYFGLYKKNQVA